MSESVQVLHAHYQDTVGHLKSREKDRQFYLAVAASLTLLAVVDTVALDNGGSLFLIALKAAIAQRDLAVSAPVLSIGLLFGVAIYAQLYFQSDVWIERMYRYVHILEEELCKVEGLAAIACEGRAYSVDYPFFSWWTYFFYKYLVPNVLMIGVLLVPVKSSIEGDTNTGALVLLWAAALMTLASASLYLGFIAFGNRARARAEEQSHQR